MKVFARFILSQLEDDGIQIYFGRIHPEADIWMLTLDEEP